MRKLFVLLALITAPQFVALQMSSAAPVGCHIEYFEGVVSAVGCPEGSHIATYKFKDGVPPGAENFDASQPQTGFSDGATQADVPPCAWQADVFTGDRLTVIDATHRYGDRLLAALYGGDVACEAATTTTTSTTSTTATTATTATTVPDTVKDTVVTRPQLAATGTHSGSLSLAGFGFTLMGIGLVIVANERKKVRSWKAFW